MPNNKVTKSRDYRTIFANGLRLRIGDNDGAITFLIETDNEAGELIHEDQIQIILTPRTMKLLRIVLDHGVDELEKAMGPINLGQKVEDIQKLMAEGTKIHRPNP